MEENKLIEEATEAVKKSQNAGCYVEGLLAFIHRLQDENGRLTKKVENQKNVIKNQNMAIEKEKAENKKLYDEFVRLDDFCATKGCICCVCEKKKTCKECSRCGSLKTEKCNNFKLDVSKYTRAIERAAKLQKQVEKMKAENTELYKEHTTLVAGSILEKQDIVKDTAKEILQEIFSLCKNAKEKLDYMYGNKKTSFGEGYKNSVTHFTENILKIAREKGVEVE